MRNNIYQTILRKERQYGRKKNKKREREGTLLKSELERIRNEMNSDIVQYMKKKKVEIEKTIELERVDYDSINRQ